MEGFQITQASIVKATTWTLKTQTREGFCLCWQSKLSRPKPIFKYLFSHCECQHSFLSSGQVGKVQSLHKPRSNTSLRGFVWLDTTAGLICASLEICNQAGDCRDSWESGGRAGCIY